MELSGYQTYGKQVENFYKIYEEKISEQHLRVSKLRDQRSNGAEKTPSKNVSSRKPSNGLSENKS